MSRLANPAMRPLSMTHQHLFAVVNTLMRDGGFTANGGARILDIGCGDGLLLSYLQTMADRGFFPVPLELHGFDIDAMGYRDVHQRAAALDVLNRNHPHVDWGNRVKLVGADDDWAYPPGYFDVAVSNQVLEHVHDLDHFLANLKRHLRPDGASVHVFPLKNCVVEGHTGIPFLHRVNDFEGRIAYATLLNRAGIGRYRVDKHMLSYTDPRAHARDTAKFVQLHTAYRTFPDFARSCNARGLALSHAYSKDLYLGKLRQLVGRAPRYRYRRWRPFFIESLCFAILKYVASITLIIRRIEYDIGDRIRREKEYQRRAEKWTEALRRGPTTRTELSP